MRKILTLFLRAVLPVCLLLGGSLFLSVAVNASRLSRPEPADALIVLGAQVYEDGTPSPALKRRLNASLSLYREGYASAVITTGAQGRNEPTPEAFAMKRYLVEQGVPEEAVFCDPDSYNTIENITHAKAIMDENGLSSAIVVTSDYHLWRALSVCGDLGIPATGSGSKNAETWPVALRNLAQETVSWIKYASLRTHQKALYLFQHQ